MKQLITLMLVTLSFSAFSQKTANLSRDTYQALEQVDQLHSQINRCSAIVVVGAVGAAFFPPTAIVVAGAGVIRFFKVNQHRRMTNKLVRVALK
jgi:hypothetical protein